MNGPTTMLAGPPHRRTQGLGALESGGVFNLCLFQRTCDPRELTIRKFFEITHPPARADERTRRALELYLCLPDDETQARRRLAATGLIDPRPRPAGRIPPG